MSNVGMNNKPAEHRKQDNFLLEQLNTRIT
jgi:hypothetical protein